jgi:hypothetical protein
MAPRTVTREDLASAAGAALGNDREIKQVTRLSGGTSKGVYRLTMDDASTVITYVWEASENYWPRAANEDDVADPFSPGNGIDLFAAAHSRLASLGLRVPEIYLIDRDRAHYHADMAILEDFPREDLLTFRERDPVAAEPTLARLREGLAVMRDYRGTAPGKVSFVDAGGRPRWPTSEEAVLALGLRCVAEASERDGRIADNRERLNDRLRELAAMVRPRAEYSVVHGELGFDHVLVDADGNPVIIDIEDLRYFDVEWEHAHMQVRLGRDWASTVGVQDLDEDRLALCMLAQRLFLVAGPMRLLDGDFPDRAFMRGVVEHNLTEALALLPLALAKPVRQGRRPESFQEWMMVVSRSESAWRCGYLRCPAAAAPPGQENEPGSSRNAGSTGRSQHPAGIRPRAPARCRCASRGARGCARGGGCTGPGRGPGSRARGSRRASRCRRARRGSCRAAGGTGEGDRRTCFPPRLLLTGLGFTGDLRAVGGYPGLVHICVRAELARVVTGSTALAQRKTRHGLSSHRCRARLDGHRGACHRCRCRGHRARRRCGQHEQRERNHQTRRTRRDGESAEFWQSQPVNAPRSRQSRPCS